MPSAFPAKMFPKSEQTELDNYKLQVEILQQKLAKSEEQRQQLEEKFDKIQKKRTENEKSIKARSRAKFEEFLDKQRERNERNKKIIRMLEHIDQQAALLAQRSSRLKAMKRQYELYFARLLQSQAFRIQQAARYSFLPINQYPTLTQAHDYTPMLEPKGKVPDLSPTTLGSQNNAGLINIPSITTIPATPPGNNISPRTQGPIQPLPLSMDINNWNYVPQANTYPGLNKMHNPTYAGTINSDIIPPYGNSYGYNMQPNPTSFYKSPLLYNYPNTMKIAQSDGVLPQQGWEFANFPLSSNIGGSPRNINPYSDSGFIPNKTDIENTSSLHRMSPSIQRTFKDYDRGEQPTRTDGKKYLNEPSSTRSEYDYSKVTEDDLDLLRELNLRNRMRTFSDSNENISQNDAAQEPYSHSRRDPHQEPYGSVSPTSEHNSRYVPRSSHSRSSSVESKVLTPSALKHPQQGDNYGGRAGLSDRGLLQPPSTFTQPSNRDNIGNERPSNVNRSSDNIEAQAQISMEDRQRRTDIIKRPQHIEESSPVLTSESYNQHQQYNKQNPRSDSPITNANSSFDTMGSANGTIASNSDKIMLPSKNYRSSISAQPENIHEISSPSQFNDDGRAADKKQRPALLKKIQIPDYLSSKSNAEKNKFSNERTDADILKLHQPSGMDSSPIQFAKKEKLKLENIEDVIYGDIINPEISMSSDNSNNSVAQVLRQHQTPAEILAQTNQGRKLDVDSFKPKLNSLQDISPTYESQIEKSDISEKLLKNKIETPNTRILNTNLEKLKINEPVLKQPPNIPSTPITEPSNFIRLPETAIRENTAPKISEIPQNNLEKYEPSPQERSPEAVRKIETPEIDTSQINSKATFDYDNVPTGSIENYDPQPEVSSVSYGEPEQYQNDVDPTSMQQSLDNNQIFPESQNYTSEPAIPSDSAYQEDQQQYDNTQNYQEYDQQNYDQNQQNLYENYPADNNYQAGYDPNSYNYNYDQQQGDGAYAAYDPNQQYSEQDYSQQSYQDPNYSDQQYNQPEYSGEPNQTDPNQYDYSQQNIPIENYEQEQPVTQPNQPMVEQQPELNPTPPSAAPSNASGPANQLKSVKPILTKEKSADAKKKRVNFIDSSSESSKAQQQLQQPTTTDESDFDFSSQ